METVAIIHGNLDKCINYIKNFMEKDPDKKPCWSRLKVTSDGAIAWFKNGKKPQKEILRFLGQVVDLEVISPPYMTVWRDGIRYHLKSAITV